MFVLSSRYEELQIQHWKLVMRHEALTQEWNKLVSQINKKGGKQFLNGGGTPMLTKHDIKRMLMLCHPDRHNGKESAKLATRKLLELREVVE